MASANVQHCRGAGQKRQLPWLKALIVSSLNVLDNAKLNSIETLWLQNDKKLYIPIRTSPDASKTFVDPPTRSNKF